MFKRLKNIENAQKNLIKDDNDTNIYYTPRSEFDDKGDKDDKDKKSPNIVDYLKSLNQKAKDLMDEREDADGDIDDGKLLFIGDNKEKFNFNTFSMPLNFLSDIYNRKISLKEAELNQRNSEKKWKIYNSAMNQKRKKKKKK